MFFQTVCSSADWVHPSARAFSAENKTDQIEDRGAKKKKKKRVLKQFVIGINCRQYTKKKLLAVVE